LLAILNGKNALVSRVSLTTNPSQLYEEGTFLLNGSLFPYDIRATSD
jgi:hypothetical protein